MNFSQLQINELITGVQLSAELPPSAPELRRFISFCAYNKNGGRIDKILDSEKVNTAFFWVADYEVPADILESGYDDVDYAMVYSLHENGIEGIANLEKILIERVDDFSLFIPTWQTDAPL